MLLCEAASLRSTSTPDEDKMYSLGPESECKKELEGQEIALVLKAL